MRRLSNHTRYDILTSAEAWSLIGTLPSEEFAAVQAEIEKLAWSASTMRQQDGQNGKLSLTTPTIRMVCEIDHATQRVTVLSLARGPARPRAAAQSGGSEATDASGTGRKR